jgi:pimeloyl-ACP methyl ester carboxylesterase
MFFYYHGRASREHHQSFILVSRGCGRLSALAERAAAAGLKEQALAWCLQSRRQSSMSLPFFHNLFSWLYPNGFQDLPPLVLVNGLAEQSSSWFRNRGYWSSHFDVKIPELLIYDGPILQKRVADGLPITIEWLTDQLELYLESFVQRPPYNLVASSLGCQLLLQYAVRHPQLVRRLVLLCPSGLGSEEKLPIVEGVRSTDHGAVVGSIFYDPRHIGASLLQHYQDKFSNRAWKKGVLRTVKGTAQHRVRDILSQVQCPVLVVCGKDDQITKTDETLDAIRGLPHFRCACLPRCGHAPQIERHWIVNRLVKHFLMHPAPVQMPAPTYARYLLPRHEFA